MLVVIILSIYDIILNTKTRLIEPPSIILPWPAYGTLECVYQVLLYW
jgi:hypothetical protein